MSDTRPIGVFDSGVGGLTVVHAVRRERPGESLLYLADLRNFPYGPRPLAEVRRLALDIIEHLVAQDTKLVVIACNTATAAALNAAREQFDVPIVGVIAPGAQAAARVSRNRRVAVLSTEGTRASGEYVHALKEANPGVAVLSLAAPELVGIVESGDADSAQAELALQPLVDHMLDWGADTLVLGCTHYPLLEAALRRVIAGRDLTVVDSAATTASRVARILEVNRLQCDAASGGALTLLVTAAPQRFRETASRLFQDQVATPQLVSVHSAIAVAG